MKGRINLLVVIATLLSSLLVGCGDKSKKNDANNQQAVDYYNGFITSIDGAPISEDLTGKNLQYANQVYTNDQESYLRLKLDSNHTFRLYLDQTSTFFFEVQSPIKKEIIGEWSISGDEIHLENFAKGASFFGNNSQQGYNGNIYSYWLTTQDSQNCFVVTVSRSLNELFNFNSISGVYANYQFQAGSPVEFCR